MLGADPTYFRSIFVVVLVLITLQVVLSTSCRLFATLGNYRGAAQFKVTSQIIVIRGFLLAVPGNPNKI